jgi:hypothetical protein
MHLKCMYLLGLDNTFSGSQQPQTWGSVPIVVHFYNMLLVYISNIIISNKNIYMVGTLFLSQFK